MFKLIKASSAISGLVRCEHFMFVLKDMQGEDNQWINVKLESPQPSGDDWVGVFSPAKFK